MRFQTLRSRSRGGAGEGPSPRPRLLLPGRRRLGEGCPRLLPACTLSHSYPHQSCAGAPKPHTRSRTAHAGARTWPAEPDSSARACLRPWDRTSAGVQTFLPAPLGA